MEKSNLIKAIAYMLTALATALLIAFGLSACTVTRTVTTTSEAHQKGDTSVVIQSRTIESYTGKKHAL